MNQSARITNAWLATLLLGIAFVTGMAAGCILCWLTLALPAAEATTEPVARPVAAPTVTVDAYQPDGKRPFEILDEFGDPFIRAGRGYVHITLPDHMSTWEMPWPVEDWEPWQACETGGVLALPGEVTE